MCQSIHGQYYCCHIYIDVSCAALVLLSSSLMSTKVMLISPSEMLDALASSDTTMVSLKVSSNSLISSGMMGIDITVEGIGSLASAGRNS